MKKVQSRTDLTERLSLLHGLSHEAFEEERRKIIEEEISKYPPKVQERLRKFQWTLDMKRKKCKNPLEACFMFHEMLMEQVYGENGLLENLHRFLESAAQLKDSVSTGEKLVISTPAKKNTLAKKKTVVTRVVDLSQFANPSSNGQGRKRASN